MVLNNEDRIAWDNAWRLAAQNNECTAQECECATYDHDEPEAA